MKKVLILGCPGAGKSTFARKLRDKTGLPLYYLDMIWHKPDRTTITKQEFDAKLSEIIKQEEWIMVIMEEHLKCVLKNVIRYSF